VDSTGVNRSDPTVGVLAHGLLNSMAVVAGVLQILGERWDDLDEAGRRSLLERGQRQATLVMGMLTDLVTGLPLGALTTLDEIDAEAHHRHQAGLG